MHTAYSGKTVRSPYYGQPTTIFGTTFRSKLEAEWAAFFTTLGIRWEYEPHKVNTMYGGYVPDFVLTDLHGGLICEVKPYGREEEEFRVTEEKLRDACETLKRPGTILRGNPYRFCVEDIGNGNMMRSDGVGGSHEMVFNDYGWDNSYLFCVCPHCWKAGYEFDGRGERICRGACGHKTVIDARNFSSLGHGDKGYSASHPRIRIAAANAAEIVRQESR